MQASPINAAQLMMEFLTREQVDIGQGIIATEFSKELEKQKLRIDDNAPETPLSPQKDNLTGKSLSTSLSDTLEPALAASAKDIVATQRSKSLKRLVSDGRPVKDTRSKIQDEMLFTNPVLLEKVLADLKVPAEARKACTSAEDKQGRLSLSSLLNVLDKQVGDGAALNPGKTLGQDVEALLKSLTLPRGQDTLAIQQLVTKPRGVYSLHEVRQVLDKAVKQVQEARNQRTPTTDGSGQRATPLPQLNAGSGEKAPSLTTPTRSAPLMASSIPSFVGENALEKDPGRESGKPSPAAGLQETPNTIRENNDSAGRHPRPEITKSQRSLSAARLDTAVLEMSSHWASGSGAKNEGAPTQGSRDSASEPLDQSKLAEGSGRESIENGAKIPREQLANAKVISMGGDLVQEVQNVLESLSLKGPELMASGKEWAATGEMASSKETPQEQGPSQPQQEPQTGASNDPAVTLVKASDTSMASTRGDSSAGDQRQNAPRFDTGIAKTFADRKINEPTRENFMAMTSRSPRAEVREAQGSMPAPELNVPMDVPRGNTAGKTTSEPSVSGQVTTPGEPRAEGPPNRHSTVNHDLMPASREQEAPQVTGSQVVQETDLPTSSEVVSKSAKESAPRVAPPPSRLDNTIERAEEFGGTPNEALAASQEGAAPTRERFSRAVSTQTESFANSEVRNTDSQADPKASKSSFDPAQTDGGTSNQQSFDSRGQAFMGYSPVSQGMSVSQDFQVPFRGETLSLTNPSWPMDMAQRMQELVKERQTSHLTLELEPKELGRLTLRVETRHEEVTAAVTAEKEQAREILLRNTQALRQNLEQQGLTLGQFLVDVRDERSSGGQHPMSDQRFVKHPPWGEAEVKNQRLQGGNGIVWIRNDTSHLINVLA